LDSAPAIILAAARTKTIRLTSAVTVLSAADPATVAGKMLDASDALGGVRAPANG